MKTSITDNRKEPATYQVVTLADWASPVPTTSPPPDTFRRVTTTRTAGVIELRYTPQHRVMQP